MNALKSTGLVRNAYLTFHSHERFNYLYSRFVKSFTWKCFGNYKCFFFLFLSDWLTWAKRLTLSTFVVGTQAVFFLGFSKAGEKMCMTMFSSVVAGARCLFACLCFLIKIWKCNWIQNKRQTPEMFAATTSLTQLPTTMQRRQYMTRILK